MSCLINLNYFFYYLTLEIRVLLFCLKRELSGSDLSLTKRRDGKEKGGVGKKINESTLIKVIGVKFTLDASMIL